jgi:ABC-type uncharacterized transport system substrate-binding protein
MGAGLRQGLADRGYIVGRNLILEERYADGDAERVPALFAELLALNVDVIATPGTPITRAARRATSTVPIVPAIPSARVLSPACPVQDCCVHRQARVTRALRV